MIRVFTTKNLIKRFLDQEDHTRAEYHARARDLNSAKLTNDLRFIQREGDPGASQMDYIYNFHINTSCYNRIFHL